MPWALPGLKPKELMQVDVGNSLLGVSLLLFTESLLSKTIMILEHPTEPVQHEEAPSIWRLAVTCLLHSLPGCAKITVQQGLFGAKSSKPTDLLLLVAHCTPDADQIRPTVPTEKSIGLLPNGQWSTASLKEYPSAFCKALVAIIVKSLPQCSDSPRDIPEWFTDPLAKLCSTFDWGASMGADFAGFNNS